MSYKDPESGKLVNTNQKQSHYSVVEQPNAIPLGVFVPEQCTGNKYSYLNIRIALLSLNSMRNGISKKFL